MSEPRLNPLQLVAKALRRLPVTSLLLVGAGFCFALQVYLGLTRPDLSRAETFVGTLQNRVVTLHPEVHGMFKLWAGEWWRLLINPLYHDGIFHLVFNSLAVWFLGELLERRFGVFQFLFFVVISAIVSGLPELFVEVEAVGLSGVAYAMFGALLVLRNDDEELAENFGRGMITLGIVWLFMCILFTTFGLMRVANGAHFAGLILGVVFATVQFEVPKYSKNFARLCMVLMLAVTAGLLYLAMHPTWLGRYHAWRALQFAEERPARIMAALERDQELPIMWLLLAQKEFDGGSGTKAFKALLNGIRSNRTSESLIDAAKRNWRQLMRSEQEEVLMFLREAFADEAEAFIANLQLKIKPFDPSVDGPLPLFGDDTDQPPPVSLDQVVELPVGVKGITSPLPPLLENGEVDPNDPTSARFGGSL